ncbi:MAG: Amuc_1100 family pilus-like protein [Kiritimatiellae bacterium]|nr:Amuc_1100 family pilus-like protein [Kiritimatiellia bacterium]
MNKNRMILAAVGGVIALAVLVMAFLTWRAYSAKVAAQEGDDEEGVDGLETVVSKAETLSRKPIYPCAESVKALKDDTETVASWRAEALKFVARGDRPIEKTTPAAFKTFIVGDAKRIASLKGSVNGALVKPDFAFGPFKDYIAEGKMPPEASLAEIQRRWDDVATVAETLAACGVGEITEVAFRDDAAAKEAAEKENARKSRNRRDAKKGAAKEVSFQPSAYGYTFAFTASPSALVKVVNALTTCERFIVIDGLSFDRTRDVIADALGGDEKKAEAQAPSGRRRRRGGGDAAAALALAAAAASEDSDSAKGGIVTDPQIDAPFAVTMAFTVYDFKTMEEGAAGAGGEAKGATDAKDNKAEEKEKGKEASK